MVTEQNGKQLDLSQIKLVACDIDGTLLQGDERVLTPRAISLICRLWEHGIVFCTSSGRQHACQRRLFAPSGIEDWMFYICENGSAVYQGDMGIYTSPLDEAEAVKIAEQIHSMSQCEALASGARFCYVMPKEESYLSLISDRVGNDTVTVTSWDDIPEAVVKVTAYCRDGGEQCLSELESSWGSKYHVALSGREWIDITQADKADGLREVCKILGISPSEVMALGDNYNDISILREAGFPIAMEHGPKELRDLAVRTFQRAEDGLEWLLEGLSSLQNLEVTDPQEVG